MTREEESSAPQAHATTGDSSDTQAQATTGDSSDTQAHATSEGPDARGQRALAVTAAIYLAGLVAMTAFGRFAFLPKEALLPLLFVPPLLAGRLREYWADWAPFLGLIVLYDALRGLVYASITSQGLPVYMGYAIAGDRLLLAGRTGPEWLQSALAGRFEFVDTLVTVVHASHFFVFFVFGGVVWFWRRTRFAEFERGMLGVLYVGLLGYALIPTVPPWMADTAFGQLPHLARPIMQTYNAVVPNLASQFDLNPIAAMPSLHCAIPAFMARFAARNFGARAWGIHAYALLVFFAVVYGGEHYLVDVLAGVALGVAADAWVARRAPEQSIGVRVAHVRAALFIALLSSSLLVAALSQTIRVPWLPGEAFIVRELDPASEAARNLRARNAHSQGEDARPTAPPEHHD